MPSRAGVEGKSLTPQQMLPGSPGVVGRIKDAVNYVIRGADTAWFGPQQPLEPIAQEAAGRIYDYMFAQNLIYQPKINEGVSFNQLRLAAEACDMVQMCLQRRKDQMAKMQWQIKPRDEKAEQDKRCFELQDFFAEPDKQHNWLEWQGLVLDDHLVLDASTLYVRRTRGGDIYGFEPMDGALIKRLIDADGATPQYPDPAYQQILKGMPAVDYTTDDIIYKPRYISTNRLYGRSPVEQAIITINLAIQRELSRIDFYTAGTVPEGFMFAPEGWTPKQIADFQQSFNIAFAGNLEKRRQLPMLPFNAKYQAVKAEQLKDELDEWIARKVCFAFSLPPTAFIKSMNRATAESAQDTAEDEGLLPIKAWFKSSIMDQIIQKYFGYKDLQFSWVEEEENDPKIAADIDAELVKAAIVSVNEVRLDRGYDPVEGGDTPMLATATGYVPLNSYDDQQARMATQDQQAADALAQQSEPGAEYDSGAQDKKPARAKSKADATEKLLKKKPANLYITRHYH